MTRAKTRTRRRARQEIDGPESIQKAINALGLDWGRQDCPICALGSSGRGGTLSIRQEGWHCFRCVFPDGVPAGGSTGVGLLAFATETDFGPARARLGYKQGAGRRGGRARAVRKQPRQVPRLPETDPEVNEVLSALLELCDEMCGRGVVFPGLSPEACNTYALRRLPVDVALLYQRLRGDEGFSDDLLIKAGLCAKTSKGGIADVLMHYHGLPALAPVVFPYLDAKGRCAHISARPSLPSRLIEPAGRPGCPKSINCGRVPIPFGLWQLQERQLQAGKAPMVFICEGEPDALKVSEKFKPEGDSAGAVGLAIPGAGSWQHRFIRAIPKGAQAINALDSDPGGDNGTRRLVRSYETFKLTPPQRLQFPRGADIWDELEGGWQTKGTLTSVLRGLRERGICYRDPDSGEVEHIDPLWRLSSDGRIQGGVTSYSKGRGDKDGQGRPRRSRLDLVPAVDGWVWVKADWKAIEPRIALALLTRLRLWTEPLPEGVDPYGWLAPGVPRGKVKGAVNKINNGGGVDIDTPRMLTFYQAVREGSRSVGTPTRTLRGMRGGAVGEGLLTAYAKPYAAFGALVKITASDALHGAVRELDRTLPEWAHVGHVIHDEIWLACDPNHKTQAAPLLIEAMEAQGPRIGLHLPAKLDND